MDVFVIEQVIDLGGVNMPMIYRQALTQHDAYAHEWRVSVKRHGHAVDLTGCTAQIYFGPENRTGDGIEPGKAMTQSATAQGGAAYAKLLPELYQIDGRVMAIMQISDPEDHVMTAAVLRLHTSGVLEGDIGDPSGSVIELGALLAQLDELRTQTAAAREAAQSANAAAGNADAAAGSANAAASAANTAAGSANSAASAANTAAGSANSAANAANTAAQTASSAASSAQTATQNANAATQASQTQQQAVAKAEAERDTAEQARQDAEQARQETFAGYEERLVAATPDDTTVDGRSWSSKKTIDSLCMPLEATGNPVQVYPVEGYPLGVRVSWEPTQEGDGDPSPDNIRPITGRDAVSVMRCGRNLIDVNPIEGEKWGNSYKDMVNALNKLPVGVYKLSFDMTLTSFNDRYTSDTEGAVAFRSRMLVNGSLVNIDNGIIVYRNTELPINRHFEFTLNIGETQKGNFEEFYLYGVGRDTYAEGAPNGALGYARFYNYQIVLGSTAEPYEPYTGSTTDIALPETVYGGTLDVETGVVTVDRRITIADGTVNKFTLLEGSSFWNMPVKSAPGVTDTNSITCSHFVSNKFGGNSNNNFIYTMAAFMEGLFNTADELNAYLVEQNAAGTPVTFVYELKNPYTIQLTPQKIAALSGVNTLYTDAGTLTVTGREDPRHTIVTLTDRIAALESAAAGV